LIHHIYKRSHDLSKKSKPGWLRLGFPLMYQTDILEILDILTRLGIKDERMQDAMELFLNKMIKDDGYLKIRLMVGLSLILKPKVNLVNGLLLMLLGY